MTSVQNEVNKPKFHILQNECKCIDLPWEGTWGGVGYHMAIEEGEDTDSKRNLKVLHLILP